MSMAPSSYVSQDLLFYLCLWSSQDWESGICTALQPLIRRMTTADLALQSALQIFEAAEAAIQSAHPTMLYSSVLSRAYSLMSTQLGLDIIEAESEAFAMSIQHWPPFPDTVSALQDLSRHYKMVVLSNVDHESFSFTRKLLEVGFTFDMVITAQDVGSYKPDVRNFQYMLQTVKREFDVNERQVLVTAQSLFHDHEPANKLALHSCWISRANSVMGRDSSVTYDFRYDDLAELGKNVKLG